MCIIQETFKIRFDAFFFWASSFEAIFKTKGSEGVEDSYEL